MMAGLPKDKEARRCMRVLIDEFGWIWSPSSGRAAHSAGWMRCPAGAGGCQRVVNSTAMNSAKKLWQQANQCPHGFAPRRRHW